jgi:hypothetical protein
MEKSLSAAAVAVLSCASALMPVTALAYLSPDQVFGGQSLTLDRTDATTYQAPPLQREGEQVVQQQQSAAASSRAAAQQSLTPTYAEPVDTYVPPQDNSTRGLFDQNTQYELRQERAAANNTGGPTIIIGGDGTVVDSNGNVLHSGAPRVTATGPESVLAIAAMILAAFSTVGYAFVKSRTLRLQTPAF